MLSREVGARLHVVADATFVVLHDQRDGRSLKLGSREWALVSCMDGSRDVGGLVVAAARRGARMTEATAAAFVEELGAAGLLASADEASHADADEPSRADDDAAPSEPREAPGEAEPTPDDRPLDGLPGYRLACDGAGSCCRLYPTIAFLPLDVVRARAAQPQVLDGGDDAASVFTPARGAVDPISAVASVEGRCAYLGRDGRCGVHAASGSASKPFGCRTYPSTFVDDGVSVRVTPRPECSCVPRSAVDRGGVDAGQPLLAEAARVRAQLAPGAFVHRLRPQVALGLGRRAPREELAAWSQAIAGVATPDAAAAFAALGGDLPKGGLDLARQRALVAEPPALDVALLLPRIERIRDAVARRAGETWRSPRDLAHRGFVALETACELALAAPETFSTGPTSERERSSEGFHFRVTIFGHLLLASDGDPELGDALEGRAAMVLVARALGVVAELAEMDDPAFRWPLSLTEALVRGFGLAAIREA